MLCNMYVCVCTHIGTCNPIHVRTLLCANVVVLYTTHMYVMCSTGYRYMSCILHHTRSGGNSKHPLLHHLVFHPTPRHIHSTSLLHRRPLFQSVIFLLPTLCATFPITFPKYACNNNPLDALSCAFNQLKKLCRCF